MSKKSKQWLPLSVAIEQDLIYKSDGEAPSLITLIFWARDAMAGKNDYFRRPDGTLALKQEKTGWKRYLVHQDVLPFYQPMRELRILRDDEVSEIKARYQRGETLRVIADSYEIPYNTAYKYVRGLRRNV